MDSEKVFTLLFLILILKLILNRSKQQSPSSPPSQPLPPSSPPSSSPPPSINIPDLSNWKPRLKPRITDQNDEKYIRAVFPVFTDALDDYRHDVDYYGMANDFSTYYVKDFIQRYGVTPQTYLDQHPDKKALIARRINHRDTLNEEYNDSLKQIYNKYFR